MILINADSLPWSLIAERTLIGDRDLRIIIIMPDVCQFIGIATGLSSVFNEFVCTLSYSRMKNS